jgi:60 kDa SS-A/Ro ribonucleoprotein
MFNYAKTAQVEPTQHQPLPGQVRNSAGGYSFEVTDWVKLDRFLILGTESGSYYATAQKMTQDSAKVIGKLLQEDGVRVVERIAEISLEGRAPKNDPAIFALAMAAVCADGNVRRAAREALSKVCRIGTHLFHFMQFYSDLHGGWGRGAKRAVAGWYQARRPEKLVEQLIKYQQRDGWSHRDVLRLSHPRPASEQEAVVLGWAVKGWESVGRDPHPDSALVKIWAFERAKTAKGKELVKLIEEYGLPHECVPNDQKNDPRVWAAMLPSMGVTAVIRNLAKMTQVGLLKLGTPQTKAVCERLMDFDQLKKGRVHPLQLLLALKTYAQGHGDKGSLSWNPVQQISNALNDAFYLAFKAVEPTNKRYVLGVDISGSMGSPIAGTSLSAREAAAAMALVTAATEDSVEIMGFGHRFIKLNISPRDRLDTVVRKMSEHDFGGTDCSLPMLWAAKNKLEVDSFCVYTDSETWYGEVHPKTAIKNYRRQFGIPAKLVVCGMVANDFSIADPMDAGMLDCVGFDTNTPALIADFCRD